MLRTTTSCFELSKQAPSNTWAEEKSWSIKSWKMFNTLLLLPLLVFVVVLPVDDWERNEFKDNVSWCSCWRILLSACDEVIFNFNNRLFLNRIAERNSHQATTENDFTFTSVKSFESAAKHRFENDCWSKMFDFCWRILWQRSCCADYYFWNYGSSGGYSWCGTCCWGIIRVLW